MLAFDSEKFSFVKHVMIRSPFLKFAMIKLKILKHTKGPTRAKSDKSTIGSRKNVCHLQKQNKLLRVSPDAQGDDK